MCDTCGCSDNSDITIRKPGEGNMHVHTHNHEHSHDGHLHTHPHTHGHTHPHEHSEHDHIPVSEHAHHHNDYSHNHSHGRAIILEANILQKNDLLAERNRGYFEAKNIRVYNLVSSPGSGKTSLLERTLHELKGEIDFFTIEGDQQTMNDADRIQKTGTPVIQINTGNGCHLDADMVNKAVKQLEITNNSVLFIENVGNLVCPSLFDLGESKRIVIVSVTEGEDKPAKYPAMFRSSDICLINKTDLLPYLDFELDKLKYYAHKVNPNLEFIEMSVKTGAGLNEWYHWLRNQ